MSGTPASTVRQLVSERRAALGERDDQPLWGLALSGGGIRSATFGLGLISALARGLALARMDLLSTVSGGGYIGAFLGRLYSRLDGAHQAPDVARALANPDGAAFMRWLRANGRYLMPRGARDRSYVLTLYLRNLVAVHLELGVVAMMLGAALVALNMGVWLGLAWLGLYQDEAVFVALRWLPGWLPPVVLLVLPVAGLAGLMLTMSYWMLSVLIKPPDDSALLQATPWRPLKLGVVPLVAAAWLVWVYEPLVQATGPLGHVLRLVLWAGCLTLLLAVGLASLANMVLLPAIRRCAGDPVQVRHLLDKTRSDLTHWLALCVKVALGAVVLGLLDRLAWLLAFGERNVGALGLALVVASAMTRALLPLLAATAPRQRLHGLLAPLGQALGYLLTFGLTAWWVSLVYRAIVGTLWGGTALDITAAGWVVMVLMLGLLGYVRLTASHADFLNNSSLHRFYRGRLARGYLGATNPERVGAAGPLAPATTQREPGLSVEDHALDDDLTMAAYRPHAHGGPVHLLNVCVNESIDPTGGLYNQDRRGRLMTVCGGGLAHMPNRGWTRLRPQQSKSLATWMAISGGAIAPAMGAVTRGGMAPLMAFAGLRLGYWWPAGNPPADAPPSRRPRWCTALLAWKSGLLLSETFGTGLSLNQSRWLLTDGGHFENTGAYALLEQKAELVVVADCGADPGYRFSDLENLVRKARIDLNTDIQMLRPRAQPPGTKRRQELGLFGSLDEVVSPQGKVCLAVGRIRYPAGQPPGLLVLVKPSISDAMPVDLANFKANHPRFPQETTADQFFSEAQWESYFRLGQSLGEPLTLDFLNWLVAHVDGWFEPDHTEHVGRTETAPTSGRLPARLSTSTAAAVGAGALGLSALAPAALIAWDAVSAARRSNAPVAEASPAALTELSLLWAKAQASGRPPAAEPLNTLAARITEQAETQCAGSWDGPYSVTASDPTARLIALDALAACHRLSGVHQTPSCAQLTQMAQPPAHADELPLNCLAALTAARCPLPRYGLYDYARDARPEEAHPNDPDLNPNAVPLPFAPDCARPLHPMRFR